MATSNGTTSTAARARLDEISANHVQIDRSAVRNIQTDVADIERSAVQRLQSSEVTMQNSAVAFAKFDHGTLRQSSAGVLVAKSVACDEVHTLVLASPVVRGEVHTLLDLRSAVAIGVGIVLGRAAIAGARALVRRVDPR
jgi:hypothetical protein